MARATVRNLISWASVGFGLIAAIMWFYSAVIDVPIEKIQSAFGTLVGIEEVTTAFQRAASWNSRAAAATGLAVLLQAVAMAIPIR
jgi:hypothetical protein